MKKKYRNVLEKDLYQSVFNPLWIKVVFIVFPLLLEIPMLMPILSSYLKYTLVYAVLFMLYDFFHQRKIFQGKHKYLLLAFVFFYGITVLINQNSHTRMNLISYFYVVVQLMILTIPSENIKNDFKIISKSIMQLTLVFSSIGLFLFLIQYNDALIFESKPYPIGFDQARLIGLYRNITSATIPVGLFASITYTYLSYKDESKFKLLNVMAVVLNYLHLILSNSKGMIIGVKVFLFVILFLFLFQISIKQIWKKALLLVLTPILAVLIFSQGTKMMQNLISYLPYEYYQTYHFQSQLDNPDEIDHMIEGPIDLEREVPEHYDKLTGRPLLWKQGLEAFSEKPILGHGAYSKAKEIGFEFSTQRFTTYHNFYVHTLFSAGLVGFLLMMSYFILTFIQSVQTIMKSMKHQKKLNPIWIFCIGMLAFFAVTGMVETNMLYMNRFPEYAFWLLFSFVGPLNSEVLDDE